MRGTYGSFYYYLRENGALHIDHDCGQNSLVTKDVREIITRHVRDNGGKVRVVRVDHGIYGVKEFIMQDRQQDRSDAISSMFDGGLKPA